MLFFFFYLCTHDDVKLIWRPLGFDSNVDGFKLMTAYLCPWLQSLQGFLSQECPCEQTRSKPLLLMDCFAHDHVTSSSTLSDDSCPDLGKYCSLQCPMGYERDDFGCEVCECSIPMPKCRPLTCTKTCAYGYV